MEAHVLDNIIDGLNRCKELNDNPFKLVYRMNSLIIIEEDKKRILRTKLREVLDLELKDKKNSLKRMIIELTLNFHSDYRLEFKNYIRWQYSLLRENEQCLFTEYKYISMDDLRGAIESDSYNSLIAELSIIGKKTHSFVEVVYDLIALRTMINLKEQMLENTNDSWSADMSKIYSYMDSKVGNINLEYFIDKYSDNISELYFRTVLEYIISCKASLDRNEILKAIELYDSKPYILKSVGFFCSEEEVRTITIMLLTKEYVNKFVCFDSVKESIAKYRYNIFIDNKKVDNFIFNDTLYISEIVRYLNFYKWGITNNKII